MDNTFKNNMKNIMRRNYKALLLLVLLAFASCSFTTKTFADPDKDKLLIQVVTYVLQQLHFDPIALDDTFSKELYSDYIENLDPVKRYFYQSDIDDFKKFETTIDDQLKVYDITFFNVTYDRMLKRIEEAKDIYKKVLSEPFDYSINESFNTDYEHVGYVKTKKEMIDRWRQQLKFSTLSNYDDIYAQEQQAKEKDAAYVMKPEKEIEKEARESTLKSIDIYFNDYLNEKVGYLLPKTTLRLGSLMYSCLGV